MAAAAVTSRIGIAGLRRIAALAREHGGVQGEAFAQAVAQYESGRGTLTLEAALGLAVGAGGDPWWVVEGLERRDAALRALAAAVVPGLKVATQATEIRRLIRRYEIRWHRADQHRGGIVPDGYIGTANEHLFLAFVAGGGKVPVSKRQLQTILASPRAAAATPCNEIPPFACTDDVRGSIA